MTTIDNQQHNLARIWWRSLRPFSFGTSLLPMLIGAALAYHMGYTVKWFVLLLTLFGGLLIHIVTNLTNSLYDWTTGHDRTDSPQVIPILAMDVDGESIVQRVLFALLGVLTVFSILFAYFTSWDMIYFPIIGYLGGVYYTKPPIAYKHRGLSLPAVFGLMGILLPTVSFVAQTGYVDWYVLVTFLPMAFLVTAILAANEIRDCTEDAAAGSITLTVCLGEKFGISLYHTLLVLPYLCVIFAVWGAILPRLSLLVLGSLPMCGMLLKKTWLHKLRVLDVETAYLHGLFGVLYLLSILIS